MCYHLVHAYVCAISILFFYYSTLIPWSLMFNHPSMHRYTCTHKHAKGAWVGCMSNIHHVTWLNLQPVSMCTEMSWAIKKLGSVHCLHNEMQLCNRAHNLILMHPWIEWMCANYSCTHEFNGYVQLLMHPWI